MTIQQCIETIPLPSDAPADTKHFTYEDVDLAYSPSTGKCYRLLTTKWKLVQPGTHKGTYTVIGIKGSTQQLHRIIAQHFMNGGKPLSSAILIDHHKHADGTHQQDVLTNLRITSHRGNQANRKGGTSKFAGVTWNIQRSKWQTQIRINNRLKYIGRFDSELVAARAYIEAGEEHGYDMTLAREQYKRQK